MGRSRAHPGVAVTLLEEGRWRLRWREGSSARSWTVDGASVDAHRWAITVSEALRERGTFERPSSVSSPSSAAAVADLREVLLAWADWRRRLREVSAGTAERDASALRRIELEVRVVLGLAEAAPIPASVLSVELLDEVHRRLVSSGVGRSRQVQVLGVAYAAWTWAADVGRWPGVPPAPRTRELVVPRATRTSGPLPAPTVEEMDAIVLVAREVARSDSSCGDCYEVSRGTGLRHAQVVALRVGDIRGLDSPVPTLAVRTGKSESEKRGRVVPLAPALVPLMRRLVEGRADSEPLFVRPGHPTMMKVMTIADERGLIRPAVWRSPDRGNTRISHWARAGFQRLLRRSGVEDRVIDVLVGHGGRTVRDRHYDSADWAELVAAVRLIPPVSVAHALQAPVELLGRHQGDRRRG
jgi:integrase